MKADAERCREALVIYALGLCACTAPRSGSSSTAMVGAPSNAFPAAGVTAPSGSAGSAGTTSIAAMTVPVNGNGGLGGAQPAGSGGGATLMPPAAGTTGNAAGMSGSGAAAAGSAGNPSPGSHDAGPESGAVAAATCPSPALTPGDTTKMIPVGSTMRSYLLHVPSAYAGAQPVPLVVDFHPLGGSGQQERQGSPYPAQTDPEGVIMAFPTGLSGPSGGAWNVGPCCVAGADDVAFARALVADVEKSACIDPKRVYAVGFSMGGGMTHYLACHAADIFAAAAPAAFDLLQENVGDCKPARPISVIAFRGSSDPIVPYAGGASSVVAGMPVTFLGAVATFQKWAELDQCTGSASAPDNLGCQAYSNCADGTEVMLCTKQGGSHEPGDASVGWPALKRHMLH